MKQPMREGVVSQRARAACHTSEGGRALTSFEKRMLHRYLRLLDRLGPGDGRCENRHRGCAFVDGGLCYKRVRIALKTVSSEG